MNRKKALIIGAGPAGLTAAYELIKNTDILPIIYEMTGDMGGISKTVNYKGNRIDIGGHRFFSKSQRIMDWWQNILPVQGTPSKDDIKLGREIPFSTHPYAPDPEKTDRVMLVRNRVSRVYFLRNFFDYPISINMKTILNLGLLRIVKIGFSYLSIRLHPIREEKSLEDFFINRFGRELYLIFFKDYTEKVWGIPCNKISPEWGSQRIKGLSVSKALIQAVRNIIIKDRSIDQKKTETTLIMQFLYPKLGPGQMWIQVAEIIKEKGGEIHPGHKVVGICHTNNKIVSMTVRDEVTGSLKTETGDYFFSTMPVKDLIEAFNPNVPEEVKEVAKGLIYRDFITVGVLLRKLKIQNKSRIKTINDIIPDNWIYIQEKEVKLGRIQIFNNWSPYMVEDENTIWMGLEYFCSEGDELWSKSDEEMAQFAIEELASINFIEKEDVLDSVVIRMPKTYPAYFGSYEHFDKVRRYLDRFENLFLIGRNGMHKYNNQDHSMLTAIIAVENITNNITTKENIWAVNTEQEYHEK